MEGIDGLDGKPKPEPSTTALARARARKCTSKPFAREYQPLISCVVRSLLLAPALFSQGCAPSPWSVVLFAKAQPQVLLKGIFSLPKLVRLFITVLAFTKCFIPLEDWKTVVSDIVRKLRICKRP